MNQNEAIHYNENLKTYKTSHYGLLNYDIVQSGSWLPTFHKNILPYSALNMEVAQFSIMFVFNLPDCTVS